MKCEWLGIGVGRIGCPIPVMLAYRGAISSVLPAARGESSTPHRFSANHHVMGCRGACLVVGREE